MKEIRKRLLCMGLALCLLLPAAGCKGAAGSPETANPAGQTTAAETGTEPKTEQEPKTEPETAAGLYQAGSYTAAASGKVGEIKVTVTFSADQIESVAVDEHQETEGIGDAAVEKIPERIVQEQSLAVDTVSGATITSQAILTAVADCVRQAGADPEELPGRLARTETAPLADVETDVLVIGGGGAGLISAVFAAQEGVRVIVVEKQGTTGGNTAMARGIFGCSASSYQLENEITATKEEHLASYMASYPQGDEKMLRILAEHTGEAADWLMENGAEFEGVNGPFTIVPKDHRLGVMVMKICRELLAKYDVEIRTDTAGTELLTDANGQVTGAKVETKGGAYNIYAKSVILATGGFSANNEMVAEYNPLYEGRGFISTAGNTGDGQRMAEKIGAQLAYMDVMKCNPFLSYDSDTDSYTMIGTYMNPGIVVTPEGKRIGNEHANYYFSPSIMALDDKTVYLIYNEEVRGMLEAPDVSDRAYETIGELAKAQGIDEAGLKATLADFAESAENKSDEFGRTVFQTNLSQGPYYAVELTPAMQGTFGGVLIDEETRALDAENQVIPGLYAAGECAGDGLYGANPVPTDCVFGKIAGINAAAFAKNSQ